MKPINCQTKGESKLIINIRVDHTLADIETMEKVSKDLKELFSNLRENIDIREYIEINTCNRYEYFLYTDDYDSEDLDCDNEYVIIQYNDDAILHLFRMSSDIKPYFYKSNPCWPGCKKQNQNQSGVHFHRFSSC